MPNAVFPHYRCCKCGNGIPDAGWCETCRVLLRMPGTVQTTCLTCHNPVALGKEFCGVCMKAKRLANGEYKLEAMWARPMYAR